MRLCFSTTQILLYTYNLKRWINKSTTLIMMGKCIFISDVSRSKRGLKNSVGVSMSNVGLEWRRWWESECDKRFSKLVSPSQYSKNLNGLVSKRSRNPHFWNFVEFKKTNGCSITLKSFSFEMAKPKNDRWKLDNYGKCQI